MFILVLYRGKIDGELTSSLLALSTTSVWTQYRSHFPLGSTYHHEEMRIRWHKLPPPRAPADIQVPPQI